MNIHSHACMHARTHACMQVRECAAVQVIFTAVQLHLPVLPQAT